MFVMKHHETTAPCCLSPLWYATTLRMAFEDYKQPCPSFMGICIVFINQIFLFNGSPCFVPSHYSSYIRKERSQRHNCTVMTGRTCLPMACAVSFIHVLFIVQIFCVVSFWMSFVRVTTLEVIVQEIYVLQSVHLQSTTCQQCIKQATVVSALAPSIVWPLLFASQCLITERIT